MEMIKIVLFLFCATFVPFTYEADICEILDANYCFYFSDSSCYIKLCQCEECADPTSRILTENSDNGTATDILCPSWCVKIHNNETIMNILKENKKNITVEEDVSLECDDLKNNCLQNKGYNGHCYFYEKNCDRDENISKRGKNSHTSEKRMKHCLKLQKKCHSKYPKHFSCKQFSKRCSKLDLPSLNETVTNHNETIVNQQPTPIVFDPLEQCITLQKNCFNKSNKHYACKQFNKRCREYALPPLKKEHEAMDSHRHEADHHSRREHKSHIHDVTTDVTISTNDTVIVE